MDWARILAYVTGMVDQELLARNEYLAAENRILKARLKGRLQPHSMSSSSDLFELTVLLLKLSEEISEAGGNRLCSIVLCAEAPPDSRLKFGQ
jgi:hypothetical protein